MTPELKPELNDVLTVLVVTGDIERMKTLLTTSQESAREEITQNLLTIAVKSIQLDVVDFLLTEYPSVPLNEEIVRAAVNTGSIPIFKALLARDPSLITVPFERYGCPLAVACMGQQSVEYLQFLLEAGADPNQDPDAAGFPLALAAALYKDPTCAAVELLLRHGARLESSGSLAAAARLGNEPSTQRLLDRGARLDADAPALGTSKSPLHIAVSAGHAGVARILIQHGADPNATDVSGTTAIEVAEQMRLKGKDVSEMVEVLGREQRR